MAQSFQQLLEGIYSSVLEARHLVSKQHLALFESYFDLEKVTDPDTGETIDALTPKTIAVGTSKGAGKAKTYSIHHAPLLSLLPLSTLEIDTLSIEFEARISNLSAMAPEESPLDDDSPTAVIRRAIGNLFGMTSNVEIMTKSHEFGSAAAPAKVKINFKMSPPPEGVALIHEKLFNYIRH